ncbi:transmembrane protein, putative [Medicago truncatula]|uniref:Transmembrane protein, putative n=1 Tax=Medicago truncatula TaxID=3880 RepID=A0A072TLS0_MEDTR|nr:transmembrane protein, putative [Medicago truncatula]
MAILLLLRKNSTPQITNLIVRQKPRIDNNRIQVKTNFSRNLLAFSKTGSGYIIAKTASPGHSFGSFRCLHLEDMVYHFLFWVITVAVKLRFPLMNKKMLRQMYDKEVNKDMAVARGRPEQKPYLGL